MYKRIEVPRHEFFQGIVLIFIIVTQYSKMSAENLDNQILGCGIEYIFTFVWSLYVAKRKCGTYMNLMSLFLTMFFLFQGGQVVLYVFGVTEFDSYNLFKFFSESEIVYATRYTSICMAFFSFGILIHRDRPNLYNLNLKNEEYMSSINQIANLIIFITVLPFLIYCFLILRTGITMGYSAINDYSNYGSAMLMKVLVYLTDYFKVAIFLKIISNYSRKMVYYSCIVVIVLFCVIQLSLGERTEPSCLILLLIWLDNYISSDENRGQNKKKLILGTAVMFLLALTFPSIMSLRHGGIISSNAVIDNIKNVGVGESISQSIAGLGYSMMPLIEVRRLVLEGEPLRYGITYFAAFTNIIPFLGIAKKYATLSSWLMVTLGMTYGPGFSMAAESYINFGVFPIPMFFFGIALSNLLIWDKKNINLENLLRGVIFVITCLTLPRREFNGAARDIFYYVLLIPYIIKLYYNKKYIKK